MRTIVDGWIKQSFDQGELAKLHGKERSLAELIQEQDSRWESAWGCDSDFKHVITLSEKFNLINNTVYIACPPKALMSADNGLELSDESFGNLVRENLSQIGKVVLLIPLNESQRHWLLGRVTIVNGMVKTGTLLNSMSKSMRLFLTPFR